MQRTGTLKGNKSFNIDFARRGLMILGLLWLIGTTSALSQDSDQNLLTVSTNATEFIPADLILFTVTINAEADNPQEAYKLHQKRESLLAGLLNEFGIHSDQIDFEPIRMHRQNNSRYNQDDGKDQTRTNQRVQVTFSDFESYEKIQIQLIKNGFDSFNGSFSSTQIENGKNRALVKAIENAREKAVTITKAAGVELGEISSIRYSDYQVHNPRQADRMEMSLSSGPPSMMDFDQKVAITASITLHFYIHPSAKSN